MKTNTKWLVGLLTITAIAIIGCGTPQVTTDPTTGIKTTNSYAPNTIAKSVANGAQVAAPLVPEPWGVLVGAVGVLIATGASIVAKVQTSKLVEHKSMLASVITGVELGNNDATKQAIQTVVSATGLQPKLDGLVQQVTSSFPKKA